MTSLSSLGRVIESDLLVARCSRAVVIHVAVLLMHRHEALASPLVLPRDPRGGCALVEHGRGASVEVLEEREVTTSNA